MMTHLSVLGPLVLSSSRSNGELQGVILSARVGAPHLGYGTQHTRSVCLPLQDLQYFLLVPLDHSLLH
jgi:hypothetical protein